MKMEMAKLLLILTQIDLGFTVKKYFYLIYKNIAIQIIIIIEKELKKMKKLKELKKMKEVKEVKKMKKMKDVKKMKKMKEVKYMKEVK